MTKSHDSVLFIGIGGYAVAIDPATGSELWRTKLKATPFVTIQAAGSLVFAGAGGELFCLDAASGAILWRNKLKGLGTGLIAFTSGSGAVSAAGAQAQEAAMAGATAAAT